MFADIKRPVPAQPLVRLILALLNIREHGLKNILEYAFNPLMGFAGRDSRAFESLAREAGLKQQEFFLRRRRPAGGQAP